MRSFLLVLLSFFVTGLVQAQVSFEREMNISVVHNGSVLTNAWAGGINAAQISKIDLNLDGLEDLFVFDRTGDRVLTFLANETTDGIEYNYTYSYNHIFPEMHNWALLRDYNCDGKADIITYNFFTGGSFRVYKNTSNTEQVSFELANPLVQSFFEFAATQYTANIYTSSQDIPAFFDYDGDGDMDVISFSINGVTTQLHLNQSMELYGVCDSLSYVLRNMCYAQFAEGSESNDIQLDYTCPFNVVNPKDNFRHAGSTVLAFDATQDGLPELVLGDITFPNMSYLVNSENNGLDSIVSFDTNFPQNLGGSEAVMIDVFPAAFYEDIDGDGVRDLIACTNNAATSINNNSVWYYKNNGADNDPDFELVEKDFLQNTMIDMGEGSYAFTFDYSGDGLPDLFIANRGFYISNGNYLNTIARYTNIGTELQPEFRLDDDNFMNVSQTVLDLSAHPAPGDLNGDGLQDWVIGDASGQVYFAENMGTPNSEAVFDFSNLQAIQSDGEAIDVGQYSTPQLFDLDEDGLLDLLIGERNGNINYFKNTGSAESFQFELITDTLGGINTTDATTLIGSSNPQFFKYQGNTYLLSGAESGKVQFYSGIDGNLNGEFSLTDLFFGGIDEGMRSKIYIADVNNDALPDMFVGNQSGGVAYFNGIPFTSIQESINPKQSLKLFPNPATGNITVKLSTEIKLNYLTRITILAGSGAVVLRSSANSAEFSVDISALAKGVYHIICTSEAGKLVQTANFIKE